METIDFLSDWQKHFAFGLGEVIFLEKNNDNIILTKIIMSTDQFDNIVDFYYESYLNFNKESLLYKYFNREYIGSNEEWAEYNEEVIENIEEFLNHILNVGPNYEALELVKDEYYSIINLCNSIIKNKTKLYFMADKY